MNTNIFEGFTGLFPKSITLRNGLEPMWETGANFNLAWEKDDYKDRVRQEYYPILKNVLDRKHAEVITHGLSQIRDNECIDWRKLDLCIGDPALEENEKAKVRKIIASTLKKQPEYDLLQGDAPFKAGGIIDDPELTEKEKIAMKLFSRFSTRLKNYHLNRDNYYSHEQKSTAVSHRVVDDNFAIFRVNKEILESLDNVCPEYLEGLTAEYSINWKQYKDAQGYSYALTQEDIDTYNAFVGLYNQYTNLYLQQYGQQLEEGHPLRLRRCRQLRPLFKQIGCQKKKQFDVAHIENDQQALHMIRFMNDSLMDQGILEMAERIGEDDWNWGKVFLSDKNLSEVSQIIARIKDTGSYTVPRWSVIETALKNSWRRELSDGLSPDKEEKLLDKKRRAGYSLAYIQEVLTDSFGDIESVETDLGKLFEYIRESIQSIRDNQERLLEFLDNFGEDNSLGDTNIDSIKSWCDSWLCIIRTLKFFVVATKEDKDKEFYELLGAILYELEDFVSLYNKLRNYITRKPYSTDKMLLKFGNPQLTDGWSVDKEKDYGAFLLRRRGKYYLAIYNNMKKVEIRISDQKKDEADFEKMVYRLFKDVSKMIPKCSTQMNEVKAHFEESEDDFWICSDKFREPFLITRRQFDLNNVQYAGKKIWQKDFLKQNPEMEAEHKAAVAEWIAFCMRFLKSYKSTMNYDYSHLKPLEEYETVTDFYHDVDKLLYYIEFAYVPEDEVRGHVAKGDIYLFQIYNKDFSDRKWEKSNKNLHTLYWEGLFSEENLENGVIKLNGGAEIFRRPSSIKNKTVHKAGEVLVNKRTVDEKREPIPSEVYIDLCHYFNGRVEQIKDLETVKTYLDRVATFTKEIDLIKDKRYTEDKFEIHIPITINYQADGIKAFNAKVLQTLQNNPKVNIIGLDRGERNLITCTVINQQGKILRQKSFNIINQMDYQKKLTQCEKNRNDERVSWRSIENIKELKAGYISQVVHELVEMMLEYNAIIVMEDLNFGFKRGRFRVERQVYQKFEVALLNKLQYVVNRKTDLFDTKEPGNALCGYQLSQPVDSLRNVGKQCGFVFYVPAAYTSKIDPVTGFVNVFDMTQISNRSSRKAFFGRFDNIFYDEEKDLFGFSFDYSRFTTHQTCGRLKWTVYSVGERYVYYPKYHKEELVCMTERLKMVFEQYGLDYHKDLFEQIKELSDDKETAEFWSELDFCFQTMLRLRNSSSGEEIDQIVSPVMDEKGNFFSSPIDEACQRETNSLPNDADTNGAYHIALKGLLLLEHLNKAKLGGDGKIPREIYMISNAEWLAFRQK